MNRILAKFFLSTSSRESSNLTFQVFPRAISPRASSRDTLNLTAQASTESSLYSDKILFKSNRTARAKTAFDIQQHTSSKSISHLLDSQNLGSPDAQTSRKRILRDGSLNEHDTVLIDFLAVIHKKISEDRDFDSSILSSSIYKRLSLTPLVLRYSFSVICPPIITSVFLTQIADFFTYKGREFSSTDQPDVRSKTTPDFLFSLAYFH